MTGDELRQKYLKFFEERGHNVVPSASLVPANDPTTLFTGSGMQPMLPYLLGEPHPEGRRIADSQRCFRVQDIEEVGDNRHTTAFEMLGNWSLGDYFKREQLQWFWQFLTEELGLDPQKLYVTVFAGDEYAPRDEEAIAIWQEILGPLGLSTEVIDDADAKGMQGGRIFAYDAKKNWWSRSGPPDKMPVGEPGGPDSEVFYDFGADLQLHEHSEYAARPCHVNCDCGRFLEIGNSVFMQYRKDKDGSMSELSQKNIDFGGGLERILAAVNDTADIFVNDLHWPIIEQVVAISHRAYEGQDQYAYQVIADHLKAAVFLLSDGVIPSNKTQGYILRRVIRRAVRFGRGLGIHQPFLAEAGRAVQNMYQDTYPSMMSETLLEELHQEEAKFLTTLDRGLKAVQKYVDALQNRRLSVDEAAQQAFDFYQTFGLPSDVFVDELISRADIAYTINERLEIQDKYQELFGKHQELSREGSAGMFKGGLGSTGEKEVQYHTVTHLLHQALRDVLGEHVVQRGSNITSERLRFDFTSEQRLTNEQKVAVEHIVNHKIAESLPVSYAVLPTDQARQTGAIGLFGEKYGDAVRVYSIGPLPDGSNAAEGDRAGEVSSVQPRDEVYSREFCGGPHVANTSQIMGTFRIVKDEKIARDVVRIKAVLAE